MKSTGIVRKVDELGRIVLPMELRQVFDIKTKDSLEIFVDSDSIILKKYQPSCVFCSARENTVNFEGKLVCASCLEKLKNIK